uniref:Uncharacterized protein n=1 Tax=Helicotheca tamesis TaxID=374047 RepID=A0A7S2IKJ8_9STRA|mmetsp:Transcript_9856/g.13775  ORF Transcript_9856/g.13775 Transcript_9856/m.13775 type:complete len:334 (+) Transcript_9856:1-1002(+)
MKLSSLEMVRVTGDILGGVLTMKENNADDKSVQEYRCQMVQEFLNCVLSCPLPAVARRAVAQFLGICDSEQMGVVHDEEKEDVSAKAIQDIPQSAELGTDILAISAACESHLAKARNSSLIAQKLASSSSLHTSSPPKELSHDLNLASLPVSTSDTSSLREALEAVMAERDEAHAKLISANVLHAHEMEQRRRKIEHLTRKLEMAERLAEGGSSASFFLGQDEIEKAKLQRYEQELENSVDTELMAVCRQLASEISARTSAALEIIRLKESQKIEHENGLAERQVLQNELNRYKALLMKEQMKSREARRDALEWKRSFESVVLVREDDEKSKD